MLSEIEIFLFAILFKSIVEVSKHNFKSLFVTDYRQKYVQKIDMQKSWIMYFRKQKLISIVETLKTLQTIQLLHLMTLVLKLSSSSIRCIFKFLEYTTTTKIKMQYKTPKLLHFHQNLIDECGCTIADIKCAPKTTGNYNTQI